MNDFFDRRVSDAVDKAERDSVAFFGFLSEDEQSEAENILKKSGLIYSFSGGIKNAERKMCAVYDKALADYPPELPVSVIKISARDKTVSLTHPECLGSIMGLGIKRDTVGDIVIHNDYAYAVVNENMVSYLLLNLTRIGRNVCDVSEIKDFSELEGGREFTEMSLIVASERLDCFVAAVSRNSREKSCVLIRSGMVFINGTEVKDTSRRLSCGDRITVRGTGKFILESEPAECQKTQKNRLKIKVKKYN